jgi:Protein of unknown function (DUF2905)
LIAVAAIPTCQRGYEAMQRLLIGIGLVLVLAGIAWPLLSRIGLGRLPGDIVIQRGSTSFYFPLVTCIVVSLVLSAVMWLLNR